MEDCPGQERTKSVHCSSRLIRISIKRPLLSGRLRLDVEETLMDESSPRFYSHLRLFYGPNTQGFISMRKKEEEERFETISHYIRFEEISVVERIEIGDYYARFGEGLVIGARFDGVMGGFRFGAIQPSFIYSSNDVEGGNLHISLPKGCDLGVGYLKGKREIYGLHFRLPIKDLELYSEYAKVVGKGEGFFIGAELDGGRMVISSSYRSYGQDFDNPYSDGFADPDGKDDDSDEVGTYLGMEYEVSPKVKIVASSNHWHHPSTLIRDSNSKIKLYWNPSPVIRFRLLREWDEEDIEGKGERRKKTSFEAKLKPNYKFKVSIYLRATEEGKEVDGFARVRFGYELLEDLRVEGYLSIKTRDIYEEGRSSTRYYLQLVDRLTDNLSILLRYTNTTYLSGYDEPDSKHQYRFCLDVVW